MAGKRQDAKDIKSTEQGIKALELRKTGMSFRNIAAQMGVSHQMAFKYVRQAIAELNERERSTAEEYRAIELERLDSLLESIWGTATATGQRAQPAAIDRVMSIMERRARLLGLDAPTKQDVKSDVVQEIVVKYAEDSNAIEAPRGTAEDTQRG